VDGRPGDALSRFGHLRGPGIFRGIGHPLRNGDDPQPLRGPDLHPAHPEHAGFRGAGEAQPVKELLKGKDIIIIEDSIIRGTTAKTRVKALRELGVKKIHMRVSWTAPPVSLPLRNRFFHQGGTDRGQQKLSDYLGLDSLYYLSLKGLLEATGFENPERHFCKACFDGCYAVHFDQDLSKNCLEIR
jgi:hypothetical protein